MLLYLARATQVMDFEVRYAHAYLDNVGTLHKSLGARQDCSVHCADAVRSFDANGNKGLWVEAATGQINK